MTYKVTVRKCGEYLATVTVDALNSLGACQQAEKMLKAKKSALSLTDKNDTKVVHWAGLDMEARKI